MKIESQSKQNIEQKDVSVQMKPEDAEVLNSQNVAFSDLISPMMNNSTLSNEENNIEIDFNYDSMTMSLEDSLFFIKLAENEGQFSIETAPNGEFKSLMQLDVSQNVVSQKTVEATNQLTALIEKAQNTQKPVRISFDNDVSVIIKIDKHGKVTAEFIPGSLEVENYLRNNIASLRQRFDEQNLPYNDLLYRNNSRQNKNKNKERGGQ